jgi:hypothetical protein
VPAQKNANCAQPRRSVSKFMYMYMRAAPNRLGAGRHRNATPENGPYPRKGRPIITQQGNILYWGIGPPGARSAFSGCCSQSEPIFPVSNLPAGETNPPPPNHRHLYHTGPLHSPPCRRFPEGPRTDPPVCILVADAFQRLLTAHRKPGFGVVCPPAHQHFSAP